MLEWSQLTQPQQYALAGIPLVLVIYALLDLARYRWQQTLEQTSNKRLWPGSQVLAAYLTARGQELTRPLSSIVDTAELYSHLLATNIQSLEKLVWLEQQLGRVIVKVGWSVIYLAIFITYATLGYTIISSNQTYLVWGITSFYLSLVMLIFMSLYQLLVSEVVRKALLELHLVPERMQSSLELYFLLKAVSAGRVYYLVILQLFVFLNPLALWQKGNETNT